MFKVFGTNLVVSKGFGAAGHSQSIGMEPACVGQYGRTYTAYNSAEDRAGDIAAHDAEAFVGVKAVHIAYDDNRAFTGNGEAGADDRTSHAENKDADGDRKQDCT